MKFFIKALVFLTGTAFLGDIIFIWSYLQYNLTAPLHFFVYYSFAGALAASTLLVYGMVGTTSYARKLGLNNGLIYGPASWKSWLTFQVIVARAESHFGYIYTPVLLFVDRFHVCCRIRVVAVSSRLVKLILKK